MIDSGRTLALAAPLLKEKGASKVFALISHGKLRLLNLHLEGQSEAGFCRATI